MSIRPPCLCLICKVWEWISNLISHCVMDVITHFILGLKLHMFSDILIYWSDVLVLIVFCNLPACKNIIDMMKNNSHSTFTYLILRDYNRYVAWKFIERCTRNAFVVILETFFYIILIFACGPFYQHGLIEITAWSYNHIHVFICNVITSPCGTLTAV